jgi:hypothetical protein
MVYRLTRAMYAQPPPGASMGSRTAPGAPRSRRFMLRSNEYAD